MNNKIKLIGVTKRYGDRYILNQVDLSLDSSHIYILVGKNGCGKSTLFNVISGYDRDYSGRVQLNDLSVGYLLQSDMLFRNLTVRENLILQAAAIHKDKETGLVERISRQLDLQNLLDRRVSELSGGEKKKVSIGQIMLKDTDVVLLDEPTANIQKTYARDIIRTINNAFEDKILVISSHDDLFEYDEKTYRLELKDGEINGRI